VKLAVFELAGRGALAELIGAGQVRVHLDCE
jgi:hypothetical protein